MLDPPALADVIGSPPGELFGEANDNSVAILLARGMARALLAGKLRFRARLIEGASKGLRQ